jgi:hypothetical protein
MSAAQTLAGLLAGDGERATPLSGSTLEIEIPAPPPKPDGRWSQVKPRTPEEKRIYQLSCDERHRLKQERILLAKEQKERKEKE